MYVVLTGEMRNAYTVLVGKPEGKRQTTRHRYEDNIRERGYEDGLDFNLTQGRVQWWALVNTIMSLRFP
jgi:hypothetical protein